jgi:processive 1,2-diacylglycerol beta-glucosyltransferase
MTEHLEKNPHLMNQSPDQITRICFFTFNFQDALSHLRLIGPARHLGIQVIYGVENGQIFVDRALLGNVIVLQRDFPRAIEAYEAILSLARQNNIPVILDFDDLLFELPEDHPDRRKHIFTWTFLPMLQALLEVDLVTVTTRPIYEYMLGFNKNVQILPNYLDDQLWQLIPPVRSKKQDKKIIIGYMGGLSHQSDLALLIPVFHNLIRRFPERLDFQFWGTQPAQELSNYPFVQWNKQIIWNYQDFAAFFQTQSADIFLSPLADNFFNTCKSAIKYLEYSSLGVPGVFSRIDPYTSVIRHGENGLLASTPQEWEDCLVRLIENPELRFTLAFNAQADIRSNWLLSQNAQRWLSAFQQANEIKSSRISDDSSYYKMIKNLAKQTVMWHRYTNQQQVELNTIINSRTWKLAQVFRRIREISAPPNSWREKFLGRIIGISSTKNHIEHK